LVLRAGSPDDRRNLSLGHVCFCGGYTTFSSFSLQTLNLLNDGEWFRASANIGLSVLACMIAVWAGHLLAASLNSMMGLTMQIPRDAVLIRIFFGEDDKHGHLPLYEAIVLKAREMHLAGATVLRGPLGFGHSSHIHTAKILRLAQDLPIVVEIVDSQDKIDAFLPVLDTMMTSGLITMEKVQVLQYGANSVSNAAG
jgi:PII-like signaling protein